jgi:hypothetical protein
MRLTRAVSVLAGLLAMAYGGWRLHDLGWANARATVVWLIGGVVLHDAVFAPLVLGVALVALHVVPRHTLAPCVVALVVLVPVTLVGIPELGRFGARADNPTLLDRPYWLGWSLLVTLVVVLVTVGAAVAARRRPAVRGGDHGPGGGGR